MTFEVFLCPGLDLEFEQELIDVIEVLVSMVECYPGACCKSKIKDKAENHFQTKVPVLYCF